MFQNCTTTGDRFILMQQSSCAFAQSRVEDLTQLCIQDHDAMHGGTRRGRNSKYEDAFFVPSPVVFAFRGS
jgi:hypothetical protein